MASASKSSSRTGKSPISVFFNDVSPGRSESQLRFRLIHFWELSSMADADNIEEDECGFNRNYFLAKELSGSSKRSSHKLSDINIVDELKETAFSIERKHENEIYELLNEYKTMYPKWVFELRCGFGLLMYGFGYKKGWIGDFASSSLTEYSVVVINGYLPSVNLKQVHLAIVELLSEQLKSRRKSSGSLSKVICVVVHNIDGPALRDPESQQTLAQLASCPHIRIIASIDHVKVAERDSTGVLRAKNAAKKLMELGLEFSSLEDIIKDGVESLKSKGFIS